MCAILVFYVVGTTQVSNLPPMRGLTVQQAVELMRSPVFRCVPDRECIYPVLKPCDLDVPR